MERAPEALACATFCAGFVALLRAGLRISEQHVDKVLPNFVQRVHKQLYDSVPKMFAFGGVTIVQKFTQG